MSKGFSCIFLFVSRRWRFDAARLRVVWLGRGPRLPHRLLSNTCAASVSPAASFIFFVVLVGLLRLQAGTSTEESSRACKSPIHHIHETPHVNCSGVARRIDCRAQPSPCGGPAPRAASSRASAARNRRAARSLLRRPSCRPRRQGGLSRRRYFRRGSLAGKACSFPSSLSTSIRSQNESLCLARRILWS